MGRAARAIIIENGKILVIHRAKHGSEYYTLVGGRVNEGESLEQTLVREIREETGLTVTKARLVYYEGHAAPYNEQYIYLCEVAPHGVVKMQETSEENFINKLEANVHTPLWATLNSFPGLPFRTPQLQDAIARAFKKGFPSEPVRL